MKKLLAVALVLGLAGVASAALQLQAVDNQDGTASVSIVDVGGPGLERYFALTCDTALAKLTAATAVVVPSPVDFSIYDDAAMNGLPVPAGQDGVWGGLFNTGGAMPIDTHYIDGIILTAGSEVQLPVTVVLNLYSTDFVGVETLASVPVTVTPEPMTMSLLALGGLGLLRRR